MYFTVFIAIMNHILFFNTIPVFDNTSATKFNYEVKYIVYQKFKPQDQVPFLGNESISFKKTN